MMEQEKKASRGVMLASSVAVLACALLVRTFAFGRDQAVFSLVARELLAGNMPYREVFDIKPPGVFLVYALARTLFGATQEGIRTFEALLLLLDAALLVQLSKKYFHRENTGWIAAAMASMIHVQFDFWHTAQPETFGGTLTLAGLLLAPMRSTETWQRARWFAVGVCFSIAGLMKPPLAGVAMVPLAAALWQARTTLQTASWKQRIRAFAVPVGAVAVGLALPVLLVFVWFWARGALRAMWEDLFVYTAHHAQLSWRGEGLFSMASTGFSEWIAGYSGIFLAGLVCLILARPLANEWFFLAVLGGTIAVQMAGVVLQGKFFTYHWAATFPPSTLLAALGIERAYETLRPRGARALVPFFGVLLGAMLSYSPVPNKGNAFFSRSFQRFRLLLTRAPLAAWDPLARVARMDAGEERRVAEYLRTHTPPQEPIFVWGFACSIYDLSQRSLSSRYIYNVPQRVPWAKEQARAALMQELSRRPPSAIVVQRGDDFEQMTGTNNDSAADLQDFTALRALLDRSYRRAETIGRFDIYLR